MSREYRATEYLYQKKVRIDISSLMGIPRLKGLSLMQVNGGIRKD
jgi:hypothetical protein